MKKKIKNKLNKINKKNGKTKIYLTLLVIYILTTPTVAYAAGALGIDATWQIIIETIFLYIPKIGITMMVYGAAEFAIANATEDTNQRIRATRFIIAGAIMLSVITIMKPYLL